MKILLLLAFVALVNADGYTYNNPVQQSSYSAPQGSVVGHNSVPSVNFVQYSQQSQQPSNSYQYSSQYTQSTGSGLPSLNNVASFGGASDNFGQSSSNDFGASQGSSGSGFGFGSSSDVNQGASNGASFNFGSSGSSGISAYQGETSGGSIDESFGVVTNAAGGNAAADVAKHLYFFSAPEEEDDLVQVKYDYAVPAKKTYKIIFIKAPSFKSQSSITIPAPPQNEEKTLVYVLVKKPDNHAKVHFKEAAPTQPSKPEVFFIKYKTQKEAEDAVAEIQSTHGASGQVIANLPAGTQAAFQSPDGSIVHNPSSVDIGSLSSSGGSVSGSSGGFSLDSLGANSFVGATVDSRISAEPQSVDTGSFSSSSGNEGGASSSSYSSGQQSVDTGSVSSSEGNAGGISSLSLASLIGGSGYSAGQHTSESASGGGVVNVQVTATPVSSGESASIGQISTVDQGNVGGSDSHVQGSISAGFSEYGLPKNKRFARNKY